MIPGTVDKLLDVLHNRTSYTVAQQEHEINKRARNLLASAANWILYSEETDRDIIACVRILFECRMQLGDIR
jgi:hypothetical protein